MTANNVPTKAKKHAEIEVNPQEQWCGNKQLALYWRKKGMNNFDIFEKFQLEGKIPLDWLNPFAAPTCLGKVDDKDVPPIFVQAGKAMQYLKSLGLHVEFKDVILALRVYSKDRVAPATQEKNDEIDDDFLRGLIESAKTAKPNSKVS